MPWIAGVHVRAAAIGLIVGAVMLQLRKGRRLGQVSEAAAQPAQSPR